MKDLREKVKEERGLIKKIELAIPGFRGYRKREDLRIADSMLRDYLANNIHSAEENLESVRKILSREMIFELLEDIGELINRITAVEGKVRHEEQGYMGIAGDYRVNEGELNRVYEFDLSLIGKVGVLKDKTKKLREIAKRGDEDEIMLHMEEIGKYLEDFQTLFETRRNVMLEVFK